MIDPGTGDNPPFAEAQIEELMNLDNYSVVAADVDGTLIAGKYRPPIVPQLFGQVLQRFGERGQNEGRVILVSGSPIEDLRGKIVQAVIDNAPSKQLLNMFEVYANGGATRFTYNDGKEEYDPTFATHIKIPEQTVTTTLELLRQIARNPELWGATPETIERTLSEYRAWAAEQGEGNVPTLLELSTWPINATVPKQPHPDSALNLQIRKDPLGERIVGLAAGVIPKTLRNSKGEEIRENMATQLQKVVGESFQLLPAGYATVNLNLANQRGKTLAIERAMGDLQVPARRVLYFGDEFDGNDAEVLEAGPITTVNVASISPKRQANKVYSLGSGLRHGPDLSAKLLTTLSKQR